MLRATDPNKFPILSWRGEAPFSKTKSAMLSGGEATASAINTTAAGYETTSTATKFILNCLALRIRSSEFAETSLTQPIAGN